MRIAVVLLYTSSASVIGWLFTTEIDSSSVMAWVGIGAVTIITVSLIYLVVSYLYITGGDN